LHGDRYEIHQTDFVVLALLCVNQVFAEQPELGKDYKVLSTVQPTRAGNKN